MTMVATPRLRGRQHEQRVLDDLIQLVLDGKSEALIIRGEAGVGKSALLGYAAGRAASDCRVAEIGGVESEMELTYAGLHQLCRPMFDHLDGLPEPQRSALSGAFGLVNGTPPDRFVVGLATLSLLAQAAEARPLVCLVDDAHWLDAASRQVLGFVARRLSAESIAMVFAVRDGEDDWPFADLPELPIGGVSEDDARALLASVVPGRLDDRVRDRIVAETGGNPLALLELPRGMSAAELAGGFGLPMHGGIPAQIEEHYLRRIRKLAEPTRQLLLAAAADPVADATTIWRATRILGIGSEAAEVAKCEQLLDIGTRLLFRHPLVRSAVYNSASEAERRTAHAALAQATDPEADPERCAWHRAQAAAEPDEVVAAELERCAARSQTRGGVAAAAAFLERSAALTADRPQRVSRRLAATQAQLQAGAFGAASGLLALAESEAIEELEHAQIELMRGLVAAASSVSGEAPLQLLKAAKRLEPLAMPLARQTYLDAWRAALFAGHLARSGGDLAQVSRAARATPRPQHPICPFEELLDGLATQITEGRAAAAPALRRTLGSLLTARIAAEHWLRWGALAACAAVTLWDFATWSTICTRLAGLARESGALALLSVALNGQAMIATWSGDFEKAAALVAEDELIKQATGAQVAPYGALLLAAYRGQVAEASALIAKTIEDSVIRGEGLGVDLARWTAAIVNNSVGRYEEALAMASPASTGIPGLYIATWMMPERIEAAVRAGRRDLAAVALREFEETANPGNSHWALGVLARSRALLSDGAEAEGLYREAVKRLGATPIRAEVARAHLVYGEWLRRQNRRVDAREQLRLAHEMFVGMSADGFAERSRRELVATGERVASRGAADTELSVQEEHIAQLARDGRTNAEIAAELFLSARTVEWHLRKIFVKLGITSRRGLKDALAHRRNDDSPMPRVTAPARATRLTSVRCVGGAPSQPVA
jgi:DNA-binding CsgD family transcriptional regulator